jgi:alanine racemase
VKNWAEISAERLTANYRILKQTVDEQVDVLAVIKADAYGHGAALCAPVLVQAGAKWLGVTDASEGATVRCALEAANVKPEDQPQVLVMNEGLAEEAEAVVRHRLTPVVSTVEQLRMLGKYSPAPLGVHLEIDTGMSRQGVSAGKPLAAVLDWLAEHRGSVVLEGVLTHFASSEVTGSRQTLKQRRSFEDALRHVAKAGLRPAWIHAGNSSSIDNAADGWLPWITGLARSAGARPMVRSGLGLYGYCLPIETEQGFGGPASEHACSHVRPVMTWKTRVTGLREVEPGTQIGYNGTFTAQRPMRLALLPVGYADGLCRALSSTNEHAGGWVIIAGQRAPIVGRVSMNLTVVDVTEVPSIAIGDEVVLLGDGVTAEDHASLAGTIPYEIVCGVRASRRLTN